ncbi:hypothetical protein BS78_01G126500 [Paspalum vaginatum]|nr:hypothetical protein BS78_01G126500 [Paspalum vaginatum]
MNFVRFRPRKGQRNWLDCLFEPLAVHCPSRFGSWTIARPIPIALQLLFSSNGRAHKLKATPHTPSLSLHVHSTVATSWSAASCTSTRTIYAKSSCRVHSAVALSTAAAYIKSNPWLKHQQCQSRFRRSLIAALC